VLLLVLLLVMVLVLVLLLVLLLVLVLVLVSGIGRLHILMLKETSSAMCHSIQGIPSTSCQTCSPLRGCRGQRAAGCSAKENSSAMRHRKTEHGAVHRRCRTHLTLYTTAASCWAGGDLPVTLCGARHSCTLLPVPIPRRQAASRTPGRWNTLYSCIPAAVVAGLVGPAEASAAGVGLTLFVIAGFVILNVKETPPAAVLVQRHQHHATIVSTRLPRRGRLCMQDNRKLTNDDPPIIRQRMAYVGFVCVASVVAVYAFNSRRGVVGFAVRTPRAARPVHDRRAQSAPYRAPRRTPLSLSRYGSACVWTACWRRWRLACAAGHRIAPILCHSFAKMIGVRPFDRAVGHSRHYRASKIVCTVAQGALPCTHQRTN